MVQGTGKSRAKHFGPAFSTFLEKNVSPFVHFNTICVVPRLIKTYLLNSLILSQNIKLIAKTIQLVRSVGGWDGEGGGVVSDWDPWGSGSAHIAPSLSSSSNSKIASDMAWLKF